MSNGPTPEKIAEWRERAAKKNAIVPADFLVYADHVVLQCGNCGTEFARNLIPNLDEPVFVCPNQACASRNWVPVKFKLTHPPGRK